MLASLSCSLQRMVHLCQIVDRLQYAGVPVTAAFSKQGIKVFLIPNTLVIE